MFLQAPSLDALAGVALAGATISPAGEWQPSSPVAEMVAGRVVTVVVPPASAALVHVR
jgi:hypothetical protein